VRLWPQATAAALPDLYWSRVTAGDPARGAPFVQTISTSKRIMKVEDFVTFETWTITSPVAGGAGRATMTDAPFLQIIELSDWLRPQLFAALLICNEGGRFKLKEITDEVEYEKVLSTLTRIKSVARSPQA
jgi:hypothetical protein